MEGGIMIMILVLDDLKPTRMKFAKLEAEDKVHVDCAETIEEARKFLEKNDYHIHVFDICIPISEVDGLDLRKEVETGKYGDFNRDIKYSVCIGGDCERSENQAPYKGHFTYLPGKEEGLNVVKGIITQLQLGESAQHVPLTTTKATLFSASDKKAAQKEKPKDEIDSKTCCTII